MVSHFLLALTIVLVAYGSDFLHEIFLNLGGSTLWAPLLLKSFHGGLFSGPGLRLRMMCNGLFICKIIVCLRAQAGLTK